MVIWATERNYLGKLRALQTGTQHFTDAANNEDFPALHDACAETHDANAAIASILPTPDPRLTLALRQTTDDMDTAMHLCDEAYHNMDASALAQSASYIQQATAHLQDATAIVKGY